MGVVSVKFCNWINGIRGQAAGFSSSVMTYTAQPALVVATIFLVVLMTVFAVVLEGAREILTDKKLTNSGPERCFSGWERRRAKK